MSIHFLSSHYIALGEILNLWRNKTYKSDFWFPCISIHLLLTYYYHPKFVHIQQKIGFLRNVPYCINIYTL
jgi:hypothetical protein